MFKKGTLMERYENALFIRTKTRKIARICAVLYMIMVGLLTVVAVFGSGSIDNGITAGTILSLASGFLIGYFSGYIFGSCVSWTYYWLEIRFHLNSPIILTLLINGYVGLFVWLIHRGEVKRLEKEVRKSQ